MYTGGAQRRIRGTEKLTSKISISTVSKIVKGFPVTITRDELQYKNLILIFASLKELEQVPNELL